MTALGSLLFNLVFFCWTAIISVLAVPTVLASRDAKYVSALARCWTVVIFGLLKVLCRVEYQIRGAENVPNGPCIVAAKHQSAWDTMVFSLLFDTPSYVLKRELLQIPFFGWALARAGMVPVDRAAGAKTLKRMVADARSRLAEGRTLVIFPQGTRVAPGNRRPYLPGVAALYQALDVPVVPVGLNSGLFWGRRSFLKTPGRIVLELLPPIAPGLPRRAFMKRLEDAVEGASDRLAAEAAAGRTAAPGPRGLQTKHER